MRTPASATPAAMSSCPPNLTPGRKSAWSSSAPSSSIPPAPARLAGKSDVVPMPPEWRRRLFSRLSDVFFIPDNKIGWRRTAVATALRLHQETPFDLIFATAPPFTDFLIGRDIKRKIQKPLVVDYRDPWIEYPFKFYPTPFHRWRHVALERQALRASSHVVTTNRRVKELILSRHPFLAYRDIDIISQGYDPEDFDLAHARGPLPSRGRAMRFAYAGVFWEDRRPDYFLRALKEAFQEQPRLRGRVEAVFIGNFRDENRKLVVRLGLQDSVRVLGYQPHIECIRELLASDVLWMVVGDDVGSPGKVYEYIGARKPILACAPGGFVASAVTEAGGTVVAPDDVQGIRTAILQYFDLWERHALRGPTPEVVERYNRVHLTNSLVRIFEELIGT